MTDEPTIVAVLIWSTIALLMVGALVALLAGVG